MLPRTCAQEEYKDLVAWWKEQLGSAVSGVKVSNRLATSPAAVSTSKYGWNANMERIMRSQVWHRSLLFLFRKVMLLCCMSHVAIQPACLVSRTDLCLLQACA